MNPKYRDQNGIFVLNNSEEEKGHGLSRRQEEQNLKRKKIEENIAKHFCENFNGLVFF